MNKFHFEPVVRLNGEIIPPQSGYISLDVDMACWIYPYESMRTDIAFKTSVNPHHFPLFKSGGWEEKLVRVFTEAGFALYVVVDRGKVFFYSAPADLDIEEIISEQPKFLASA